MVAKDFKLPRTPAEFSDPRFRPELLRLEKLLNGLKELKVQINTSDGATSAVGVIQFSGDEAIIVVNLT